jgi:hypothetical protein
MKSILIVKEGTKIPSEKTPGMVVCTPSGLWEALEKAGFPNPQEEGMCFFLGEGVVKERTVMPLPAWIAEEQ